MEERLIEQKEVAKKRKGKNLTPKKLEIGF